MITPYGEIPNDLAGRMSLAEQHEWLVRRVSRRTVLRVGAAVGVATPFLWAQSARATAPSQLSPRLAYGPDPRTSMEVGFSVQGTFRQAAVHVSPTASPDARVISASSQGIRVRGSDYLYARSSLTGLTPDTAYDYTIDTDGLSTRGGTFRTAPTEPRPFRFTAFGDQGTGVAARSMLDQLQTLSPSLHLLAGDLCYADRTGLGGVGDSFRPQTWDEWLAQNSVSTATTPWMTVVGNHEMEPGFGQHGYAGVLARVPLGGRSALSVPVVSVFTFGNVGFVGLDSNDLSYEISANRGWTGGTQTTWLDSTLNSLRAPGSGIDQIVVFMHHSAYTTSIRHSSEDAIRTTWGPLFDQHSVDLVISGHSHCFERTYPMRGGKVVGTGRDEIDSSAGTTYVTIGGGGANLDSSFRSTARVVGAEGAHREPATWSVPTRTDRHAVLSVDVRPGSTSSGASMTVRAVDEYGGVLDHFDLRRTAVAQHQGSQQSSGSAVPWIVGGSVGAAALAGGAVVVNRLARGRDRDESEM